MIAQVFLWGGSLLLWLGGVGLLKMRNPYDRLQTAGVGDIGGVVLVLVGVMLEMGFWDSGGIPLLLLVFLAFTGPLATHAIAKAAFVRGERPEE
ncbi:MAG: monovalent cation/H(+) antiporter subunit G [Candidatus Bipolaricaulota bacterium]